MNQIKQLNSKNRKLNFIELKSQVVEYEQNIKQRIIHTLKTKFSYKNVGNKVKF
jgi:hypothetical protein